LLALPARFQVHAQLGVAQVPNYQYLSYIHDLHKDSALDPSSNLLTIPDTQSALPVPRPDLHTVDGRGCRTYGDCSFEWNHCLAYSFEISLVARNGPDGRHRDNSEQFSV